MTAPNFGELVRLQKDGWDGVPDSLNPYYVGAKDGLFIHRRLMFGRGVVRIDNWPENFPEFGSRTGKFIFEADPIPAKIMGQIVDFFQRIYDRQQTEAAVLLTMHNETKEWGVFVPTQLVSHGGVNYVYDPTHIRGNRTVVGSIHSHADFSPFHSGTDTGDAADFDGLHCTIGYVNKEPKIVAMVSMNKRNMDFGTESFPSVFDWSEIGQHSAPDWWDQYVGTNAKDSKPVGHELYAKFAKPTVVKEHVKQTPKWTPPKPYEQRTITPHNWVPRPYTSTYEDYIERQMLSDWGLPTHSTPLRESQQFNARKMAERGLGWRKDDGSLVVRPVSQEELLLLGKADETFWEDLLGPALTSAIMDSDVVTDEDIDFAIANPDEGGDPRFWIEKFLTKVVDAADVLKIMGVTVSVTLKTDDHEFLLNKPQMKGNGLHAVR